MAVRIDRLLDPFDNSMSCLDLSESLAFRKTSDSFGNLSGTLISSRSKPYDFRRYAEHCERFCHHDRFPRILAIVRSVGLGAKEQWSLVSILERNLTVTVVRQVRETDFQFCDED
ncbi:hypothetical protein AVEN_151876-1 [Araneus ventricosus]|uniref:Uncharacterized protein n=1 Tax=Araneus ventricosus TaxID=182803 RepID=A0A4Y2UW65_ARAVE|nr:hypothetical protein AVEN_151876-1 [Araneus ventricosus]